jgi:hypothetical protein
MIRSLKRPTGQTTRVQESSFGFCCVEYHAQTIIEGSGPLACEFSALASVDLVITTCNRIDAWYPVSEIWY